jgi:hypothetical protein
VNKTIFGDSCEEFCNNCPINNTDEYGFCHMNGSCYNESGLCPNASYTGDGCSELCSSRHNNCLTCDRDAMCLECINRTRFGDTCEESCDKCPINDTDEFGYCNIHGICDNSTGLCTNISYSGEGCSELCSSKHGNCLTCDRSFICSECIDRTSFGNTCEESCDNCPGNPGYCYIDGTCEDLTNVCDNDTLTGDNCSVPCSDKYPNCLRCDRENKCHECVNKKMCKGVENS